MKECVSLTRITFLVTSEWEYSAARDGIHTELSILVSTETNFTTITLCPEEPALARALPQ